MFMCHAEQLLVQLAPLGSFDATMNAAFQTIGSVIIGMIATITPTKVTVNHKIHRYRQEEVEEVEGAFLQMPLLKHKTGQRK
jgi:hypothetical protein